MKSAAIKRDEADGSEDVNMSDQLEVRVARIESDVQHIKEVTTDLRVEVRRTNDKIDATNKRIEEVRDTLEGKIETLRDSLEGKIETLRGSLEGKIDSVEGKLDGLQDRLHSVTVRALLLYLGLAGTLLGVLAKGFKWI